MRALAPHRLLPGDAEPGQVVVDRLLVVRPAARRVDVLDAQQEPPAGRARHVEIDQRGQRMAEMQMAVRARRETEHGRGHAHRTADRLEKGLRCDDICRCFAPVMSFFIHTEADLDHAIAQLVAVDPRFGAVLSRAGRPPLRRRPDGFAGLASIVVSQQLSTASAAAIWGRLTVAFDPFDHAAVLRARRPGSPAPACRRRKSARSRRSRSDRSRRARPRRARGQAGRRGACGADRGARHRPVDRRHLSAVLPRPCRRLAGRRPRAAEAARLLLELETRPTAKEMGPLAEAWRPWRGAAACLLWSYYRATKQRDGAPIPATPTERRTNG